MSNKQIESKNQKKPKGNFLQFLLELISINLAIFVTLSLVFILLIAYILISLLK